MFCRQWCFFTGECLVSFGNQLDADVSIVHSWRVMVFLACLMTSRYVSCMVSILSFSCIKEDFYFVFTQQAIMYDFVLVLC